MTIKLLASLAFLSLAACSREQPPPAPSPAAPTAAPVAEATPGTITYRCGNGRTLEAVYRADKAIITWGDKTRTLSITRSASGARYVGDGLEWWTKGMREGTLRKVSLGELESSDVGITCTTDDVKAPAAPPPPKP